MSVPKIMFHPKESDFNIHEAFSKHGWKGQMSALEAEKALSGSPVFTYLTRFGEKKDKFTLSYVHPAGYIEHDYFVLIDWMNGIFLNGQPWHQGSLDVVVLLMMNCKAEEARPL